MEEMAQNIKDDEIKHLRGLLTNERKRYDHLETWVWGKNQTLPQKFQNEVQQERKRQNEMWGVKEHSMDRWLVILGEEYGEICRAVLEQKNEEVGGELVHLAAVGQAIYEQLEGRKK